MHNDGELWGMGVCLLPPRWVQIPPRKLFPESLKGDTDPFSFGADLPEPRDAMRRSISFVHCTYELLLWLVRLVVCICI